VESEDDSPENDKVAEELEGESDEEEEENDEDYVQKKDGLKRSSKKGSKRKKSNENAGRKKIESKVMETSPRKALTSPSKGSIVKDLSGGNEDSRIHNRPTSKVFSRKNIKEKSEVDKRPIALDKKQGKKRANASVAKSNTKEKGNALRIIKVLMVHILSQKNKKGRNF
jgi:hypothetical protein